MKNLFKGLLFCFLTVILSQNVYADKLPEKGAVVAITNGENGKPELMVTAVDGIVVTAAKFEYEDASVKITESKATLASLKLTMKDFADQHITDVTNLWQDKELLSGELKLSRITGASEVEYDISYIYDEVSGVKVSTKCKTKTDGALEYAEYNSNGNRISFQEVLMNGTFSKTTFYVNDGSGRISRTEKFLPHIKGGDQPNVFIEWFYYPNDYSNRQIELATFQGTEEGSTEFTLKGKLTFLYSGTPSTLKFGLTSVEDLNVEMNLLINRLESTLKFPPEKIIEKIKYFSLNGVKAEDVPELFNKPWLENIAANNPYDASVLAHQLLPLVSGKDLEKLNEIINKYDLTVQETPFVVNEIYNKLPTRNKVKSLNDFASMEGLSLLYDVLNKVADEHLKLSFDENTPDKDKLEQWKSMYMRMNAVKLLVEALFASKPDFKGDMGALAAFSMLGGSLNVAYKNFEENEGRKIEKLDPAWLAREGRVLDKGLDKLEVK